MCQQEKVQALNIFAFCKQRASMCLVESKIYICLKNRLFYRHFSSTAFYIVKFLYSISDQIWIIGES